MSNTKMICRGCANRELRKIRKIARKVYFKTMGMCEVCMSIKKVAEVELFKDIDINKLREKNNEIIEREFDIRIMSRDAVYEKDMEKKSEMVKKIQNLIKSTGKFHKLLFPLDKCKSCGIIFHGDALDTQPSPSNPHLCMDCEELLH